MKAVHIIKGIVTLALILTVATIIHSSYGAIAMGVDTNVIIVGDLSCIFASAAALIMMWTA